MKIKAAESIKIKQGTDGEKPKVPCYERDQSAIRSICTASAQAVEPSSAVLTWT
jgi:hypothetical protein